LEDEYFENGNDVDTYSLIQRHMLREIEKYCENEKNEKLRLLVKLIDEMLISNPEERSIPKDLMENFIGKKENRNNSYKNKNKY